ncbi:MAG: hypothetical protein FD146_2622 [Anaerolineaceae bacterium]|nr:MAG: hypothetical protein FD146_2622 [Anaerolineaceae bacterium]
MKTNLIDRYIAEIGKHLPAKNRADIQKEIRSTLEDMLEERSRKAGREADEEMIVALLEEFGKPEKVAASYAPERQLIGPQLYPIYLLILKIVLPIVATVLLVTSAFGLAIANLQPAQALAEAGKALLGILSAVVSAVGSITITFAILDRIPGFRSEIEKDKRSEEKDWDPRDLPEVRDVEKFSIPGLVADIVFDAIAIVIFNFYPHLIGFTSSLNSAVASGGWSSVPFFPIFTGLFFSRFVPWLTLVWGLDILINIIVLHMGSWKTITRLCNIAIRAGAITVGAVMLATPGLLNFTAEAITAAGPLDASTAELLAAMARQGFASVLVVVMVVEGIEIVKHIYRMVAGRK